MPLQFDDQRGIATARQQTLLQFLQNNGLIMNCAMYEKQNEVCTILQIIASLQYSYLSDP